jgi:hypothetical protein
MNVQIFKWYSQKCIKKKTAYQKEDKITAEIIVMDYRVEFREYYGNKIKTVERFSKNLMKLT